MDRSRDDPARHGDVLATPPSSAKVSPKSDDRPRPLMLASATEVSEDLSVDANTPTDEGGGRNSKTRFRDAARKTQQSAILLSTLQGIGHREKTDVLVAVEGAAQQTDRPRPLAPLRSGLFGTSRGDKQPGTPPANPLERNRTNVNIENSPTTANVESMGDGSLRADDLQQQQQRRRSRAPRTRRSVVSTDVSIVDQTEPKRGVEERALGLGLFQTDRQKLARERIHRLVWGSGAVAPDYVHRRWWDVLMLFVIMFQSITASAAAVMDFGPGDEILFVDCVVSAVMLCDMAVVLHTAIHEEEGDYTLISDRNLIFQYHARRGSLAMDLCGSVPADVVLWFLLRSVPVWRVLRCFRLLKLHRYRDMFKMTDRGAMDPAFVRFFFWYVPLLRQAFVCVTAAHLLTLGRIVVSPSAPAGECENAGLDACTGDPLSEYCYAAFWVWALLTTQGIAALENGRAFGYASWVMLMGLLLQGHVIAKMSALMMKSNVAERNEDMMRSTLAIMQHYSIPASLQQEVLSFQYHSLQQNAAAGFSAYLDQLPGPMQREVGIYVKVGLIEGVPMFHGLPDDCRLRLANCLEQMYCEPDNFIIEYGEEGQEMYFMMHGFADVIVPVKANPDDDSDGDQEEQGCVVATIKRGDFFGEVALLKPDQLRSASIQALTYCDLYRLQFRDFSRLRDGFTELRDRVEAEAHRRGLVERTDADATASLDKSDSEPEDSFVRRLSMMFRRRSTKSGAQVTAVTSSSGKALSPVSHPRGSVTSGQEEFAFAPAGGGTALRRASSRPGVTFNVGRTAIMHGASWRRGPQSVLSPSSEVRRVSLPPQLGLGTSPFVLSDVPLLQHHDDRRATDASDGDMPNAPFQGPRGSLMGGPHIERLPDRRQSRDSRKSSRVPSENENETCDGGTTDGGQVPEGLRHLIRESMEKVEINLMQEIRSVQRENRRMFEALMARMEQPLPTSAAAVPLQRDGRQSSFVRHTPQEQFLDPDGQPVYGNQHTFANVVGSAAAAHAARTRGALPSGPDRWVR